MVTRLTLSICFSALLCLLGAWPVASSVAEPVSAAADTVYYQLVQHPETAAELPRISLPERPEVEAKVNRSLDSLAATMQCPKELLEDRSTEGYYESSVEVTQASQAVLSVYIRAFYYCGGAYPTNGANLSLSYDLRTGMAVPFRAHFARYDEDQEAIAEAIVSELKAARLEEIEGADDQCKVVYTAERMRFFNYHIEAGKLIVEPELPRVIQACGIMTDVPIGRLRPFLASDSFLLRLSRPNEP